MPKNILICCDGTNNQFTGDHTNVIRTYKVARRSDAQVTFYDPGVGTMPEPWETSRAGKQWSIVKGLAFGSGFEDNIADAYGFLMKVHEPGDHVFVFGFSRGAFTARALAGLLHSVGLLRPGAENLVRYALSYWRQDHGPDSPGGKLCAEFKATLARECPVHFIGVWDTVSSVGYVLELIARSNAFPYVTCNPSVSHVRHAAAIDERRHFFRQNLMRPCCAGHDVKNVWFAGVHSDVGGGYPAREAGLAKLAFAWMMREAAKCGLDLDPAALDREVNQVGEPPNPSGRQHDSLVSAWWIAEVLPARRYSFADNHWHWGFSFNRPRDVLRDAAKPFVYLHESVIAMLKAGVGYAPANLPHDEGALRATFQIEA
jgi:uncharacterized protein (DUF2235 family)